VKNYLSLAGIEVDSQEHAGGVLRKGGVKSGHYIHLIEKGSMEITLSGHSQMAMPGQMVWVGAGIFHEIVMKEPSGWLTIRLRNKAFSPDSSEADRQAIIALASLGKYFISVPVRRCSADEFQKLHGLANQMLDTVSRSSSWSTIRLKALALEWITFSMEILEGSLPAISSPVSDDHSLVVHRAFSSLENHPSHPEDTHQWAAQAGVSRSGLYRAFSGMNLPPPAKMLKALRLEKARRALLTGNQSVLQIALDAGFPSLSSFYRAFGKSGLPPPLQYRKKFAGNS